ncbi:MAG TPA: trypsin-like peptidase domain-containing protein, partial [Galbitalea sp.]|nr:trypsin-like peptidase domain-containing protein [Galbitalea sp.]
SSREHVMSITPDGHYQPETPLTDPTEPKKRSPWIAVAIATAAVICIGGLGTAAVAELTANHNPTSSSSAPNSNSNGTFGHGGSPYGNGGLGGLQGGQAIGQQAAAGEATATASTAAQEVGVVTINTTLDYNRDEQAAGTGMILTSNGYVLTNNHVVESSTSISVTVVSTGKTYTATVVGTDKTADVAVLKLTDASGLTAVKFASTEKVTVGESIHSVGNAEGTGNLVTAVGTVGAVTPSLAIGSDESATPENLSGLIQLNSDVVSGDSGGPLFDQSGHVIGIVTAASSGSSTVTGYAINIAQVLKVANSIEAGSASSEIVIGYPAFAGINIATTGTTSTTGVPVASTFAGMPANQAGIGEGDVITAVNGVAMTTPDQLTAAIQSHKVGDTVNITWTDPEGVSHTAPVTLIAGPAA